jgi:hypothetical protein
MLHTKNLQFAYNQDLSFSFPDLNCRAGESLLITGRSGCGKTTLALQFCSEALPYFCLDDPGLLAAVRADPTGFVRRLDCAIIDEVQRAPELLMALKLAIDKDRRPGRFLLTGSANLMALPQIADSLAGRSAFAAWGRRGRRARGLWKTGLTHRSLRPGCHRGTHRAFRPLRAIAAIRPIRAHGTLWPAHPVGGSAKPAVRTGSHGAGRPRGGRWPWRLTRRRAWNRHHGRCRCTLRNAR